MLKACAFDSKTGELGGAMPLAFNVSDAFVRLQRTLKLKAGTLETRKTTARSTASSRSCGSSSRTSRSSRRRSTRSRPSGR
jgi:hypothetical protein